MELSGRRQAYSEDGDTGVPCDPCLIDNVSGCAHFYCTNCDEFLCDTCARNHRKYKASRQHQLLDRDEMPNKKISNAQDKFCAKHDEKLIEYFCDEHDTCCCSVCVTLYHGQCNVKYIDDVAKGFSSSQNYKFILEQIRDIEKQLAKYKNKFRNDSKDVNNCFRQLQADIQVFRSEINLKIDALEHELMQQAQQIRNEDTNAIESMDTLYDKLLVDMLDISSTLGLLEKSKQNQQLFIHARKAETQVREYNDKTQCISEDISVRKYAFSRNEYIMKILNSPSKLGSLEMKIEGERRTTKKQTEKVLLQDDSPTIDKVGMTTTGKRREEQQAQTEEKKLTIHTFKPTKVNLMKNIKMNPKKDTTEVWITGSVLMSSELLAVADHDDKSIKVVDLHSDTITCDIQLDDNPWDITCMDPETLVVTCDTYLVFLRYERKSGFLRFYRTLTVVKKVQIESGCSGITYRNGALFVTFYGEHPSVKRLNHEGKVLQTFKHNAKGKNLFFSPRYITVNSVGDTMYVSDGAKNTVTGLSMDGQVCNVYRHNKLSGPLGLTLGDDNSIYVAGRWSHNIHQITPNCTLVRILLGGKDGLIGPQTVLYNKTGKTLYISSFILGGDLLSVYKLE